MLPSKVILKLGFSDIVLLLIDRGAGINTQTKFGETALLRASYQGRIEVVKILIAKGADLEIANNYGYTPLILASREGFLDVITVLLEEGAVMEAVDNGGRKPLYTAILKGKLEVTNLLLENGENIASMTKGGHTPLHAASFAGSMEIAKLLLKKGAVIESVARGGLTPLHVASLNDSLDVVNILLEKGADIESVDICLGTPLHIASASGHLDVVDLLLEKGAAIESGNFDDRTLLRYVSPYGQLEVISNLLRSQKLRIDIRIRRGCTPLFYVVARGPKKVVKLLLPRLAANSKDRYSVMRLLATARNGYEETIEQLITLAGLQSKLGGLGRDMIWWAIGIGRGRILGLIHQWCYTRSFGARIPQASDDKLWYLVNLDLGRICDACTRPILIDTSYRRCEGCNNFNICLECVGVKVKCLDTAHEWFPCGPGGLGEDETDEKDEVTKKKDRDDN
ncbi:hypothetical protein PEX1_092990 [Penicillium expansum]|nr:hypothetical protein PEX1_092990 [Penicillium expansum]